MPFTTNQFLKIFETYNQAIYPVQWILQVLAIAAVLMTLVPRFRSSKIIAALLFALWGWTGVIYHWLFFSGINKAAYLFSLLFIIQAIFFLFAGVIGRELHFHARLNP